ncbi:MULTISPECIES: chorismate mutase [unclassified Lactococcus]|uniref:chorismate mutase n=1 Tax=unclassified Lactococcus TaxID=2643510 RepID=UPI0011CB301B|nr:MULTISPECIES: chorismate mutase [unclassified Lactococcus]MQW23017.1 chorismate mutase [Lactococcus sp. dk101]TXK44362.1 chorismate mutase [Lactococcus sp. dk310]TXK50172.1 chorismate mutase [Lactococcus sp. dk322]
MNLEEIRKQIDSTDKALTALIEQRMALVLQVAEYKKASGKAVLDPSREQIVLDKIATYVENPNYTQTIVSTYKDIMAHSREFQTAYLKK